MPSLVSFPDIARLKVVVLFLKVAQSQGISLSVPEGSMISFHNSPYYSHNHCLAIDLYSSNLAFGGSAPSPVDGIVRCIRRFESPGSKWFEAPKFEPLILVEGDENPKFLLKILHLNPSVQESDHVHVGNSLGTYLRSAYFHRWTDPHMHIEIRHPSDPIRARGGLPIAQINDIKTDAFSSCHVQNMSGRFSLVADEYALIEMDVPLSRLGYYSSLAASIDGVQGLLDCGIPHYESGGLLLPSMLGIRSTSTLRVNGEVIGRVSKVIDSSIVFDTLRTVVKVNEIPVLGLSLRLHVGDSRTVKVIPTDLSDFPYMEGDAAEILIQGLASER